MNIMITKAFLPPGAHRALEVSECITVPSTLANQWISEGRAVRLDRTPTKQKRETASL
jgi:hypothetical protein